MGYVGERRIVGTFLIGLRVDTAFVIDRLMLELLCNCLIPEVGCVTGVGRAYGEYGLMSRLLVGTVYYGVGDCLYLASNMFGETAMGFSSERAETNTASLILSGDCFFLNYRTSPMLKSSTSSFDISRLSWMSSGSPGSNMASDISRRRYDAPMLPSTDLALSS